MATAEERFWAKVNKSGACWCWKGRVDKWGYGYFNIKYGKKWRMIGVHRFSWLLHNGGFLVREVNVLHRCDNPSCINPNHLFLGTHTDNMKDKSQKGRHHETKKTHCPQKHTYSKINTYCTKTNKRACRTCNNLRRRTKRQQQKTALDHAIN